MVNLEDTDSKYGWTKHKVNRTHDPEKMEMSHHDKYTESSYLRELETERVGYLISIMSSEDHLLKILSESKKEKLHR
jgi:hypothetical protein